MFGRIHSLINTIKYRLIIVGANKLFSQDLLNKIICSDDLIVDNEQQVLVAILMWYSKTSLSGHLSKLGTWRTARRIFAGNEPL
jgi:hypothetical protein